MVRGGTNSDWDSFAGALPGGALAQGEASDLVDEKIGAETPDPGCLAQ